MESRTRVTRTGLFVLAVSVLISSCGASSDTGSLPPADDRSAVPSSVVDDGVIYVDGPSPGPEPVPVTEPAETLPTNTTPNGEFVEVNPGGLPSDEYVISPCPTVLQSGDLGFDPMSEFDYIEIDAEQLRRSSDAIGLFKIVGVGEPAVIVPTGLTRRQLDASGAVSNEEFAWSAAPVTLEVVETWTGPLAEGQLLTLLEPGCVGPGAVTNTALSATVLMALELNDNGIGPTVEVSPSAYVRDSFPISSEGILRVRSGVLGPDLNTSRFLIGMSVDEARQQLQ